MSIQFCDIEKKYGEKAVLRGASWCVRHGEIGVVLGANGTGKSTLLRILASLVDSDRGAVQLAGETSPAGRRRVSGFVGHVPPLTPALSVGDNLRFRCKLFGARTDRTSIEARLRRYDLIDLRDQAVRSLSRGQAQRAALAAMEVGAPQVVLLDEPFTGLDVHQSERLIERLLAWRSEGRAVMLTTHDVPLGRQLADKLSILKAGKLFEVPQPLFEAEDAVISLRGILMNAE